MAADSKSSVKKFLTITVTVAVLLALLPLLLYLLGVAVNLTFLAIEVTGILIFLVGMPLFFWIMGEAGYKVFLRPFVRAHRIRTIRNRRLLREAVERRNNSFE